MEESRTTFSLSHTITSHLGSAYHLPFDQFLSWVFLSQPPLAAPPSPFASPGWLLSCEVGPRAWNFHKWLPALARLALYKPTQAGRRALLFRGERNWDVRSRGGTRRGVWGKDKVEAPPTPILHVFMPLSLFRFVLCRVVFLGTKMHPWTRTLNWACVSGNLLPPTILNPSVYLGPLRPFYRRKKYYWNWSGSLYILYSIRIHFL